MDLVGGGVDSRGSYVSKILYVKTKELGPLGGACAGRAPLDPPMFTETWSLLHTNTHVCHFTSLCSDESIDFNGSIIDQNFRPMRHLQSRRLYFLFSLPAS